MEGVNVEITNIAACKLKLKISVTENLLHQFEEKVYLELQKTAKLPGFRVGNVPLELIKLHYKPIAEERIINKTINETLFNILEEKKINYINESIKIESISGLDKKNFSYEVVLDTEPEFKLKSYKGLKLKKEIRKVVQKDIDNYIEQLRQYRAKLVLSEKKCVTEEDVNKDNIFCVIKYITTYNGKKLSQLSSENALIQLSDPQLPKEFKEGLIGMSRGETKKIVFTIPANFSDPQLASQQVDVSLTLIDIKEKQLPVVNDEFAKDLGYKDLNDLYNSVKELLQQQFDKELKDKLQQQILDYLANEHNFPLPETELKNKQQQLIDSWKQTYISYGGKEEDFQLTQEQQNLILQRAQKEIKLKYILKKIIQQENIQVTKEELEKEKGKLLTLNPQKEKSINEYFEKNIDFITSNILLNRVIDLIIANSKIKEVDITPK